MFKGREITRLMLIAALCCVLMVAAVTAYLVVSSRQHLKSQTEKMEQALADSIGKKLDVSFDNITTFLKKNPSIPFTSDAYNILLDLKRVLNFFVGCAWSMFDCDYAVILDENGNIYAGLARDGMDVNDFPIDVAEGMDASVDATAYKIVDSVAGRQGSFIIIARDMTVPTLAGTMREAMVINATDQVAALSQVYDEDKGDMVTRQVLVSLGIFLVLLALSILIIYFAIRRRLSGPIESINDSARSILSGKEAGSVEPDEKSIFYNLQLLLKSGSVIFRKSGQMEEGACRTGERQGRLGGPQGPVLLDSTLLRHQCHQRGRPGLLLHLADERQDQRLEAGRGQADGGLLPPGPRQGHGNHHEECGQRAGGPRTLEPRPQRVH